MNRKLFSVKAASYLFLAAFAADAYIGNCITKESREKECRKSYEEALSIAGTEGEYLPSEDAKRFYESLGLDTSMIHDKEFVRNTAKIDSTHFLFMNFNTVALSVNDREIGRTTRERLNEYLDSHQN